MEKKIKTIKQINEMYPQYKIYMNYLDFVGSFRIIDSFEYLIRRDDITGYYIYSGSPIRNNNIIMDYPKELISEMMKIGGVLKEINMLNIIIIDNDTDIK